MRLRHIEVFNAIMLSGTVSAAARMLNVSQPSVTRVLQHAELSLGFALFRRVQGQRLEPTEEAVALHGQVEKVFLQLDSVRRLAGNLRQGESGLLRVLAIPSLAQALLPEALSELRRKLPALSFDVRTLHSREIVAALLLREADVGFVFEAPSHPAIQADALGQCELVAVLPRALLPEQAPAIALERLRELPEIRLPVDDPVGRLLAERAGEPPREGAIEVQTYFVALRLAEKGLGVACVDPYTAAFADPAKVSLGRIDPPIVLRTFALRARSSAMSVAVREMIAAFARVADVPAGAQARSMNSIL